MIFHKTVSIHLLPVDVLEITSARAVGHYTAMRVAERSLPFSRRRIVDDRFVVLT